MDDSTNVCKRQVATLLQNSHTFRGISQEQSIVVPSHDILPHIGNLEHLAELFCITSKKIQEGKTIKVLGPLITHLHNLMVALTKSLASKFAPNVSSSAFLALRSSLLLNGKGTFHGGLDIATSKSETETSARFPHKVKSNLRKALGLKVGNNGTTTQPTVTNHVHDLTVLQQ